MYRIYYKRDGRFRPMPYKGMPGDLLVSINTLRYILGYTNTFRIIREDFRWTSKEVMDFYMKTGNFVNQIFTTPVSRPEGGTISYGPCGLYKIHYERFIKKI